MTHARMQHAHESFKLGPSGSRPKFFIGDDAMGNFETIAVVAAVYAVVFLAHRAARSLESGSRTH